MAAHIFSRGQHSDAFNASIIDRGILTVALRTAELLSSWATSASVGKASYQVETQEGLELASAWPSSLASMADGFEHLIAQDMQTL